MANSQPKVIDKQYKLKTKYILELILTKKNRCLPLLGIKKNIKIAFSYVTRGKIWKIYLQEFCFNAWHIVWMCFY